MKIHSVAEAIKDQAALGQQRIAVTGVLFFAGWRIMRPIQPDEPDLLAKEEIDKPGHIRRFIYYPYLVPDSYDIASKMRNLIYFNSRAKRWIRRLPTHLSQVIFRSFYGWEPVSIFLNDPRIHYLLFDAVVDHFPAPVVITGTLSESPYPDYVLALSQIETILCRASEHMPEEVTISIPPAPSGFIERDWEVMPSSRGFPSSSNNRSRERHRLEKFTVKPVRNE